MSKAKTKPRAKPDALTRKRYRVFDSLVRNAFDFLTAALRDIKTNPKYSVISFYSAIELFFKARLLKEHWTLIVQSPEKAKLEAFIEGDFASVGLDQAAQRIRSVCGEASFDAELQCFKGIRDHRNRLVHFHHRGYSGKNKKIIAEVVSEQCRGWYLMHQLLTNRWRQYFGRYAVRIAEINGEFCEHREFLKAKFAELGPEIERKEADGVLFAGCDSCGFRTAEQIEEHPPLRFYLCLVCHHFSHVIALGCPHCGDNIEIRHPGDPCPSCGDVISAEQLARQFSQPFVRKVGVEEVFCANCGFGNVMTLEDGTFFCPNCEEHHGSAAHCEFCDSLVAGLDPDGSYAFGCGACEGAIAWNADKD